MATLRVLNTTATDVFISDVGVLIPASGNDSFTSATLIRELIMSQSLRTLVTAGTLTMDDGAGNPITVLDLYGFWGRCGFNTEKAAPFSQIYIKSTPSGIIWKITVTDAGILVTTLV